MDVPDSTFVVEGFASASTQEPFQIDEGNNRDSPLHSPEILSRQNSSVSSRHITLDSEPKTLYDRLRFSDSKWRTGHHAEHMAISPSGRKVAMLTLKQFWVFNVNPLSLACTGQFVKKNAFKYGKNEVIVEQLPLPDKVSQVEFACAALNDEYLAVGVKGNILAFLVHGDYRGRWVFRHEIKEEIVLSLQFSGDGSHILSLVGGSEDGKEYEKVLLYSYKDFPRHDLERAVPVSFEPFQIQWQTELTRRSKNATFSRNGLMVAIYTNFSGSNADIRLLARTENSNWVNLGVRSIQVFQRNDPMDRHGKGLTGISLYLSVKVKC